MPKEIWKPTYREIALKQSRKGILDHALAAMYKFDKKYKCGFNFVKQLDKVGYHFEEFVLVGKPYPFGSTVSCNNQLANFCQSKEIWLVMYIKSAGHFYVFHPNDIRVKGKLNNNIIDKVTGSVIKMINFDIKLGINLKKKMVEDSLLGYWEWYEDNRSEFPLKGKDQIDIIINNLKKKDEEKISKIQSKKTGTAGKSSAPAREQEKPRTKDNKGGQVLQPVHSVPRQMEMPKMPRRV